MTTSLFTKLLSLLKSTGTVYNFSTSLLYNSAFKLGKSDFTARLDVSIPTAFFKSFFAPLLDKSSLTFMSPYEGSYVLGKY